MSGIEDDRRSWVQAERLKVRLRDAELALDRIEAICSAWAADEIGASYEAWEDTLEVMADYSEARATLDRDFPQ